MLKKTILADICSICEVEAKLLKFVECYANSDILICKKQNRQFCFNPEGLKAVYLVRMYLLITCKMTKVGGWESE